MREGYRRQRFWGTGGGTDTDSGYGVWGFKKEFLSEDCGSCRGYMYRQEFLALLKSKL